MAIPRTEQAPDGWPHFLLKLNPVSLATLSRRRRASPAEANAASTSSVVCAVLGCSLPGEACCCVAIATSSLPWLCHYYLILPLLLAVKTGCQAGPLQTLSCRHHLHRAGGNGSLASPERVQAGLQGPSNLSVFFPLVSKRLVQRPRRRQGRHNPASSGTAGTWIGAQQ